MVTALVVGKKPAARGGGGSPNKASAAAINVKAKKEKGKEKNEDVGKKRGKTAQATAAKQQPSSFIGGTNQHHRQQSKISHLNKQTDIQTSLRDTGLGRGRGRGNSATLQFNSSGHQKTLKNVYTTMSSLPTGHQIQNRGLLMPRHLSNQHVPPPQLINNNRVLGSNINFHIRDKLPHPIFPASQELIAAERRKQENAKYAASMTDWGRNRNGKELGSTAGVTNTQRILVLDHAKQSASVAVKRGSEGKKGGAIRCRTATSALDHAKQSASVALKRGSEGKKEGAMRCRTATSAADNKRRCMYQNCSRELAPDESYHCAEHMKVHLLALNVAARPGMAVEVQGHNWQKNNPTLSSKRAMSNPDKPLSKRSKLDTNGAAEQSSLLILDRDKQTTLQPQKQPLPHLTSPPEDTSLIHIKRAEKTKESEEDDEDDVMRAVKLAAEAVSKEVQHLGLHTSPDQYIESVIKRFALEVFYPLLSSAKERCMSMTSSSYSTDRVIVSSLLALQEMLTINAEKFFPVTGFKESSVTGKGNSKLKRDFARAVVQSAAKRLKEMSFNSSTYGDLNQDQVLIKYLEASRSYETKGEDFQFALDRLDARSTYQNTNGSKLSTRESIMARTSFNFARGQHPLLSRGEDTTLKTSEETNANSASVPAPNACAFFVMDESKSAPNTTVPETEKESFTFVDERHVRRTEARETVIRELKRAYL